MVFFGLLLRYPIASIISCCLLLTTGTVSFTGADFLTPFVLATIVFGLSTNFWPAWIALFFTGAFDNVSVVIRHTILQLATPDHMRGRVSAVNGIFIGSSNEIGAFESGVAARAIGIRPSIVFGGILTVLVVAITARVAPKLRKLNIDSMRDEGN